MSLSSLQGVITGGATTIIDYNLTPNKVVVSDADGKVTASSISVLEVGYLAGTNDLIQTQLNSTANQSTTFTKTEVNNSLALTAPTNNPTFTGTVGGLSKQIVQVGNVDNLAKLISTPTQLALDVNQIRL